MTEAEAFNRAIETAHDEDVSAWAGAIGQGIKVIGGESVLLLELQRSLKMPLIQIWLALLLSGYGIEQRGRGSSGLMVISEPNQRSKPVAALENYRS